MDVLDDILGSLRLTGGVVIDGEFTGDFCVWRNSRRDHFAPFFPDARHADQLSLRPLGPRSWSRSRACRR